MGKDVVVGMEQYRRSSLTERTVIKKWGNSQAIRIPKRIMTEVGLCEDDTLELNVYDGEIIMKKIDEPRYLNLQERLEAFYGRPIDEIYVENSQEVDTGAPVGNEEW
jgi:antitoxin MazE